MQKTKILKSDFERYLIPVPVDKLWWSTRKKYLFGELEKRHPCFSHSYNYDAKMCLKEKKLSADVVVIEKQKLIQYGKKKYTFFGFIFEECRFRRFIPQKTKLFFSGLLLIPVMIFSLLFMAQNKSIENNIFNEGNEKNVQENIPVVVEKPDFNIQIRNFLSAVKNQNGKIMKLHIETNENQQKTTAVLKSVFPEKLMKLFSDFSLSALKYAEGAPELTFSFWNKNGWQKNQFYGNKLSSENSEKIRKLLVNNQTELLEENLDPYSVSFMFSDFGVFQKLEGFAKETNLCVSELSVSQTDREQFMASIKINSDYDHESGIMLSVIYENRNLFPELKKSEEIIDEVTTEEEIKKIGEVNYSDGRKVLFYKDSAGKLIRKIEEEL